MATGGQKAVKWSLDDGVTLELGKNGRSADFRGLVLFEDMLIVIDNKEMNVQMYSHDDGKLLGKSGKLESSPMGLCVIGSKEFTVILKNSKLIIMSFQPTIKLIKTLDIIGFDICHAVGKVESVDKVVVIGENLNSMHYCFVSLKSGQIEPFHQICKGVMASHLAFLNNTVYISISGGDKSSDNDGVYAYDIANCHTLKFLYQHEGLKGPWGLTVDKSFIFVCNRTHLIYQLTHGGELLNFLEVRSLPVEIFFDEKNGVLHTTTFSSNEITQYRLFHQPDPDPAEVPKMDATSFDIRVLVVGNKEVGKTSLTNHLLGKDVKFSERHSNKGIDVHVEHCKVSSVTGEWTAKNSEQHHCPIKRVQNQELVVNNSDKIEMSSMRSPSLKVYDFQGQNIISSSFPIFLRSHAVYLLVVDLNQLKDLTEGKVYDEIEIWLNSIHSYEPPSQPGIPPVILVFTHLDKIQKADHEEVMNKCFEEICYSLIDKPTQLHLKDFIGVDNSQFNPQLKTLQKMILEFASNLEEKIPANWLPLEKPVMELKASGTKVISSSQVEKLNQNGPAPREIAEQLDLGVEDLEERTVLDALNSLINAKMFILRKCPHLRIKWFEFKTTGKLSNDLIDNIWTPQKNPEFHKIKNLLLRLMDEKNIVIRLLSDIEGGDEIKEKFFVPCMLDKETPKEVICPKPDNQMTISSALCYVFTQGFMASHVFYRLLAACMVRWSIAKRMKENLIFSRCCVFELVQYHKLILHFREHVIFARVVRKGIPVELPSSELCIEVREFITDKLNKINECLHQESKFACFIQCAESNIDSVNGLIPVSQLENAVAVVQCDFHDHVIESHHLSKFWFEDVQKMDTDGQIYSGIPALTAPEQRTDLPLVRQERFGGNQAEYASRRNRLHQEDPVRPKKRYSGDQVEYAPKRNHLDKQGKLGSISSTSVMEKREIEARRKHHKLIIKLNEHILENSFKNIKRMALVYLGRNTVKKAKDMHELCSYLEEKSIIDVGRYRTLIKIMKDAGVNNAVDIILKTGKKIKVIRQNYIPRQEQSEISSQDSQMSDQDSIHSCSGSD